MKLLFIYLISYLIGSIPSGYIFTKYIQGVDLREFGSGNVGATNVTRVMGLKYGIIVALLDIGKGYLSIWLARYLLGPEASYITIFIAAFLVIAGHDWSIYLKFSGGKGVATTVGVILNLLPTSFIVFAIIWVSIVFITQYVSLASIMGTASVPISAYFTNAEIYFIVFTIILAGFIIFTHRSNIRRLLRGEENKMGWPPRVNED